MKYWLMKSEPDVYGIDHLRAEKRKTDHWDGIRNYQARNFMRDEMRKGDLAFFYAMPLCRGNMPNWVKICEIIDDMDVDLIIPGHGPTGGKRELQDMQEFMQFMVKEVQECFKNGMSEEEADKAIDIGDWAKWPEAERKTMNISNLYSTFQSQ